MRLRAQAEGATTTDRDPAGVVTASVGEGPWRFRDGAPVTIVCAALPPNLRADDTDALPERLVNRILKEIPMLRLEPQAERRMIEALTAAHGRSKRSTPELCLEYLRAWQRDREKWCQYVGALPRLLTPRRALQQLGLTTEICLPREPAPVA